MDAKAEISKCEAFKSKELKSIVTGTGLISTLDIKDWPSASSAQLGIVKLTFQSHPRDAAESIVKLDVPTNGVVDSIDGIVSPLVYLSNYALRW